MVAISVPFPEARNRKGTESGLPAPPLPSGGALKLVLGGGLSGYVKSKPLGNGQIISIDVMVFVMIIAVFHKKLI